MSSESPSPACVSCSARREFLRSAVTATVTATVLAGLSALGPVQALAAMEPDVEALLANRLKPTPEYYVVPIDMCFELVGLMRVHWHGFSGGARVWDEIQGFFSRLMDRSVTVPADTTSTAHA